MGFPWRRAQQVALPLVMPALAARTATGPRGPGSRRVLAAQALSWGGDLALLGAGRGRFLTGLTSFLGAHVAYTSALRSRSSEPLLGTPGRRRFLAAGAAAASGMALAAAREDRAVALPVAGYGVTLATMVAAAAAVDPDRGRGAVAHRGVVVPGVRHPARRTPLRAPRPRRAPRHRRGRDVRRRTVVPRRRDEALGERESHGPVPVRGGDVRGHRADARRHQLPLPSLPQVHRPPPGRDQCRGRATSRSTTSTGS